MVENTNRGLASTRCSPRARTRLAAGQARFGEGTKQKQIRCRALARPGPSEGPGHLNVGKERLPCSSSCACRAVNKPQSVAVQRSAAHQHRSASISAFSTRASSTPSLHLPHDTTTATDPRATTTVTYRAAWLSPPLHYYGAFPFLLYSSAVFSCDTPHPPPSNKSAEMDNINFDINEALKLYMSDPATIPTPEADGSLFDCENEPDSLTNGVINPILNPIIDAVAENPDAITRSAHFDSLQFLLKCAPISLPYSNTPFSSSFSVAPFLRIPKPTVLASSYVHSTPASALLTPEPTPPPDDHSPPIRTLQGRVSKLFANSRYTAFLPTHALSKVFDLITSGLSTEADIIHTDLESDEQELLSHHKQLLEIYGFLLQWTISCVETKAIEKTSAAPAARGRKSKSKKSAADKDGHWDSAAQLQTALDTMCKVLRMKLGKIFLTTSERDTFIGLLTRPVYMILESEQRVKNTTIRMHAFKVLCIAVKHHGHGYGTWNGMAHVALLLTKSAAAQISIVQNLTYFEHLSEPMAEFLHILAEQYDYPQLGEEILRELSNKEFNSNDTRGPKSVSTFMIKLSELAPRLVIKQMTMLAKQLDSEVRN